MYHNQRGDQALKAVALISTRLTVNQVARIQDKTVSGQDEVMAELRKTGESQYEVLVDGQVVGQVWNWHGSWSAQAGDKTYHGHKSRKQAVKRVEQVNQLTK
jgi:hypothetical protein